MHLTRSQTRSNRVRYGEWVGTPGSSWHITNYMLRDGQQTTQNTISKTINIIYYSHKSIRDLRKSGGLIGETIRLIV